MSNVLFSSATAVAAMLARREISSRELTELTLARIEKTNPELNAVVETRAEEALSEAAAADEAISAGRRLGALHGVPMTIKESFHVTGMRNTWGNPAFADAVSAEDAVVVSRLRSAGAVIVGTTNVPYMLADNQTANEIYGVTNNPWDVTRTPGGSSGGAAAAVAAGLGFLEFGSDVSGSIRNPAAYCGVYGFRPTPDVVPLTGHEPPYPSPDPIGVLYLLALGPIARSATDLRLALTTVGGPDGPSAAAYTWTLPLPRHTKLREFRVGVVLDHSRAPVSRSSAELLSGVVDALSDSGARLTESLPDDLDLGAQFDSFGEHMKVFMQPGGVDRPDRMRAREVWTRWFEDVDVVICPAGVGPALPHDTRPFESRTITVDGAERPYHDVFFWTSFATFVGLPAAVAPIGLTEDGLPIAVQIIGPPYEDDTVLTFAELLAADGVIPQSPLRAVDSRSFRRK